MQAVILAAGMGKRLKELTRDNTKCMVKVNGVTLIERMLHQLEKHHLSRIVIVVGYEGQKLIDFIATLGIQTPIVYVNNPIYDKTNNIYSLFLAKEYLRGEDTLLLESDIIFEDALLDELVNDPRETLALVDKYESWMDGTCLKVTDDDKIRQFIPGKKFNFKETAGCYKTVNIYKFSRHFSENLYVPFLDAYSKALGNNEYYEQVLRVIMILDEPEIRAKRLNNQRWYEIDDIQDLDIAESIFAPDDDDKVSRIQKRYGGYWRYPKLLDFCYLVNPYFPPSKLIDELTASAAKLLTQYPSGMRVNSLLAAKNFGVHEENILVGNGAAELIKSVMENLSGKVGFVRPTFEEYPNRYDKTESIYFTPANENFSYGVDELINFFGDKELSALIIVNPDNPTGNFIPKYELIRLINWSAEKNLRLIVDESFVDFADENETLIEQNILSANKHLCVVKSLSKSHGIGGLRLGVLASGDTDFIAALKKNVAIWNINSFAEFYMQIAEKYKRDYLAALQKFRAERKRFSDELEKFPNLRVVPSQANFIMVELVGKISAAEVTKNLLVEHNLLVKDLSAKIPGKNYLRIAVRNSADNDILLAALKKIMGDDILNNWKKIWNARKDNFSNIDTTNFREVFGELMHIDGYDSNSNVTIDSLIRQHENLSDKLNLSTGETVFEVGCGAGVNLYLFARDGFEVGGLDYSATLIDIAKKVLPAEKVSELICAEADELSTEKSFDAVISVGVFIYFDDLDYAERVLEKMLLKSRRAIAVLDVYDTASEAEHMAHRRRTIENYDERYKDLKKLFYPRNFFEDFAARHDLSIRFAANELENYVNAPFTYHCFMERR